MVGISFGIGLGFYWIPVEFVAGLEIFFFLLCTCQPRAASHGYSSGLAAGVCYPCSSGKKRDIDFVGAVCRGTDEPKPPGDKPVQGELIRYG